MDCNKMAPRNKIKIFHNYNSNKKYEIEKNFLFNK
jgi:hypothetical protein